MDLNNVLSIQHQIKENSEDLQKYLLDLESWEKEMKQKEEELKLIHTSTEEEIPPIRNTLYRPKRKNKHKKQKEKLAAPNTVHNPTTDYQSWEKFDAEAEIKKIDEDAKQSSASETSENEDDFSYQKRQQLALVHKDKGNNFFKNGNYDSAINSYTTGLLLDPENPLLAANRAMAFLKKEQFQAAENDCNLCLSIDPTYVKAYLRRGTARKNLKKFLLAKDDFARALELEPENKQAQIELKKLTETCANKNEADISEKKCVETQDFWPQFLENKNKPFKRAEESSQEVKETKLSRKSDDYIFTDSSISTTKASSWIDDLDSRVKASFFTANEDGHWKTMEAKTGKKIQNNVGDQKLSVNNTSENEENAEVVVSKPHLPPVPVNSFQFLNDWNRIDLFPDLRYKYLKQFPPEQFPIIFKHDMEPTIFPKLFETLSTSFIEHGDDVFNYMKYLSDVGRFQTMIMFLSEKEENDLKKLFEYMKTSDRPESEISLVVKKYGA